MKQLSSIDLYYLTKEFEMFKDQRIDSFYFEDQIFHIKFYIKGKGAMFMTNALGKYIYFDNNKSSAVSHPVNFVQYLRKYLKNGYLTNIEQIENERILKLTIDKKQENEEIKKFHIFIEIFSTGNVIVTDENLNIINSLIKKKYKDRKVLVNEAFELPPKKELNIFNLDESLFKSELSKEKDFKISAFLATRFGIGGKYANEICEISGLDNGKFTSELDEEEITTLTKNLLNLPNNNIESFNIIANTNEKQENIDFIPFKFVSIPESSFESTSSFNDAIKNYYSQFQVEEDKREKQLQNELKKFQKRLQTQIEHKETVLEEYEKLNNVGNIIYNNYALVDELLTSINKSAKEKGWEHVLQTIENNPKLKQKIVKLNYKNNEIILELE